MSQIDSGSRDSSAVVEKNEIQSASDKDALEAYRTFVAGMAKAADGRVIFNRSVAHAAIVVEYLFRGATRRVNILTGKLFEPVYGAADVIDAAVAFMTNHPDAKLDVISEEPIDENHPLRRALKDAGAGARLSMRVLKENVAAETAFHFAVADGNSFRFEPNKKVLEAVVQFGKKDVGEALNARFDRLQKSCIN